MARYEVFIPAAHAGEFNVTLKVEADNWMAALKSGMKKLGEQGSQVANIMVDIMEDNSIHVTDSTSGRVFRIKELEEGAQPAAVPMPVPPAAPIPLSMPAAAAPIQLVPPAPIPLAAPPVAREPIRAKQPPKPPVEVPGADAPTPKDMPAVRLEAAPEPPKKPARVEQPTARETPAAKAAREAPPAKVAPPVVARAPEPVRKPEPVKAQPEPAPAPAQRRRDTAEPQKVEQIDQPSEPVTGPIGRTKTALQLEDIFADLFERTAELEGKDSGSALAFLLDLALEKIPADAGSVFLSDLATADLELLSARGPKARELERMKLRLPVGVGIVGFCALEAVSLAISDTQKDPRFHREVSQKIGYEAKSILCAPMVSGGRTFGCIEIINKKGTSHFSDSELAILGYVAHQGARYLEQH